jgi:nucleoside-diphosphate-sugar epimerase
MEQYLVVGGGYLGQQITSVLDDKTQVTITSTTHTKAEALGGVGTFQAKLHAGAQGAKYDVLDNKDGIVICMAPSRGSSYEDVFIKGVDALVEQLKSRLRGRDLHLTFISSTGVYGNQGGCIAYETLTPDFKDPTARILSSAEDKLLSLENESTKVCILRLGGIYGPGRDMASWFKQVAGQPVAMAGEHACAWVHVEDAAEAVAFAYQKKLSGVYNVCDDWKYSRREIGSLICDKEGLPPILWNAEGFQGQRNTDARVGNSKIKRAGFKLKHESMLD